MKPIEISHSDIQFIVSNNKNIGLIFKHNQIGYIQLIYDV